MIYILIPFYNESENIEKLFSNLKSVLNFDSTFFVFVDDGSTDNSPDLISKYFTNANIIILGDGKNHGPGFSFNLGFEWILQNSKNIDDVVITMEADNTSDVKLIPKMLKLNQIGFNLVLASIYCQGGSFEQTKFLRKILSFFANILLRLVFNIKVLTLSSFYRLYSISLIKNLKNNYNNIIEESGFISMIEILIKCIKLNAEIIEIPMKLNSSNRSGKSKMKIFKTILSYTQFLFKKVKLIKPQKLN